MSLFSLELEISMLSLHDEACNMSLSFKLFSCFWPKGEVYVLHLHSIQNEINYAQKYVFYSFDLFHNLKSFDSKGET
jgi:hypothetical protein